MSFLRPTHYMPIFLMEGTLEDEYQDNLTNLFDIALVFNDDSYTSQHRLPFYLLTKCVDNTVY